MAEKNVSDIPEWISNILEENGMSSRIYKSDDSDNRSYAEIEFTSDNGEDVVFTVDYATNDFLSFIQGFRDCANDYDPDEHVEMWIPYRGKNGVPKSIRTLLDDADSIGDVLMKTAEELYRAERIEAQIARYTEESWEEIDAVEDLLSKWTLDDLTYSHDRYSWFKEFAESHGLI